MLSSDTFALNQVLYTLERLEPSSNILISSSLIMDDNQASTPLEQAQATPASSDTGVKPELNASSNIGKTSSKCHKNHKHEKAKKTSKSKHTKKSKKRTQRTQSSEESSSSEEDDDDDSADDSDSSSSEEDTEADTKKKHKRKLKLKKLLQRQTKKLLEKEKRKNRKHHISSSESSTESDDSEDAADDEARLQRHSRARAIRNMRNANLEDSDEEYPDDQDDRAAQIDNIQLALDGLRMQKTHRSNNALYGGGGRRGLGLQAGRRHLRKGLSEDETQGHSRYKYKRVDEIWDSESCTRQSSSNILTIT